MRVLICETHFYISACQALCFLKKAPRYKNRQYQLPLRNGNTLNVIRRNTICNGINSFGKKDQTLLEEMFSQMGCTVNVVEENESKLNTATRRPVTERYCMVR